MMSCNAENSNILYSHTEVTSTVANSLSARLMYIIAIAWLYVVVMIAAVSDSILKGVIRLVFLGLLPVGLWLWIKLRMFRAREAAHEDQRTQALPPLSQDKQDAAP